MQPTIALSDPVDDPSLSPENDVTPATARVKQLPLPTGYSQHPGVAGKTLADSIPLLWRKLSTAYEGSSPHKYHFSTHKVGGDIGAAPISPTVLAFHTKQFPALATSPVWKSKQSSSSPSTPPSAISTLDHCTQSHRDNVWQPHEIVYQPSVKMNENVKKPEDSEPSTSQWPPDLVFDGKTPESQ